MTGAANGRWRGGRAMAYGPGWKALKERIRERDRVCRRCGKTPRENGRALDVHHLNPFRFSGDNDPANLVALCRSCHMRADDHGRRGSRVLLSAAGRPPRPTKREIRTLQALARATERRARREEGVRAARSLRARGASLRAIGALLGVSHQTVADWLRRPDGDPGISGEGALTYLVS